MTDGSRLTDPQTSSSFTSLAFIFTLIIKLFIEETFLTHRVALVLKLLLLRVNMCLLCLCINYRYDVVLPLKPLCIQTLFFLLHCDYTCVSVVLSDAVSLQTKVQQCLDDGVRLPMLDLKQLEVEHTELLQQQDHSCRVHTRTCAHTHTHTRVMSEKLLTCYLCFPSAN